MRRTKTPGSVSLSIKRVGLDGDTLGQVYHVEKYDDFISKKFDNMYEYFSMSASRTRSDRGDSDNPNNNNQYR